MSIDPHIDIQPSPDELDEIEEGEDDTQPEPEIQEKVEEKKEVEKDKKKTLSGNYL
jgi:hypothetical protein